MSETIERVNEKLGVPREGASRVFLELAACLIADPVLRDKVVTWVVPGRYGLMPEGTWREFQQSGFAIGEPHCPAIVLHPEPRDGQPRDNISQQATLSVRVELYVVGLDPLDALDLWGVIQRAVYPETQAEGRRVRERLYEVGATGDTVRVDQPAIAAAKSKQGGPIQVAEGSISVEYEIRGA